MQVIPISQLYRVVTIVECEDGCGSHVPLQVNVGSGTGYVRTSSIECCHSPSLMSPGADTIVITGEDLPEIDTSLQATLAQVEEAVASGPLVEYRLEGNHNADSRNSVDRQTQTICGKLEIIEVSSNLSWISLWTPR